MENSLHKDTSAHWNSLFGNIKEHKSKAEKGADLMTWF